MVEGKSVAVFDGTIVRVETDAGIAGWGEAGPLGPLNSRMDAALKGHPYVKWAIDMACWDILGKTTGQSVCTLLGGRQEPDVALHRAISQQPPRGHGSERGRIPRRGVPQVPT